MYEIRIEYNQGETVNLPFSDWANCLKVFQLLDNEPLIAYLRVFREGRDVTATRYDQE